MHESHHERRRKQEESERNDRRFDAYNLRRIRAGLKPLNPLDYFARKHGYLTTQKRLQQLIEAEQSTRPEHRDNVALLTR